MALPVGKCSATIVLVVLHPSFRRRLRTVNLHGSLFPHVVAAGLAVAAGTFRLHRTLSIDRAHAADIPC
jgi:hypothetical protein